MLSPRSASPAVTSAMMPGRSCPMTVTACRLTRRRARSPGWRAGHCRRGLPTNGEHLRDADATGVERQCRCGHVEPPDPGSPATGQRDGPIPPTFQIVHPTSQGAAVVLAQALHVAHLEVGALDRGDHVAQRQQFTVGEDEGTDERPTWSAGARPPDDLVVEQSPARHQQPVQRASVLLPSFRPEVFGHADARDGVERLVDDVTPVLHPNVDKVGDTLVDHALARILGLLLRQRDTDRLNAVLFGRVHDERPPPAPDVEQPHARTEAELPADQFELVALGVLEGVSRVIGTRPVCAGIGHRRAQHDLVEVIADVVVVGDCDSVPALRVPLAGERTLLRRWRWRQTDDAEQRGGPQYLGSFAERKLPARREITPDALDARQRLLEVTVEVDLSGHPGPTEADLVGLPEHASQGAPRVDQQCRPIGGAGNGTVPCPDPQRHRRTQNAFEDDDDAVSNFRLSALHRSGPPITWLRPGYPVAPRLPSIPFNGNWADWVRRRGGTPRGARAPDPARRSRDGRTTPASSP